VNAFLSENQRMSFSRIRRFSRKKGEAGSSYAFLIFCCFFIKKKAKITLTGACLGYFNLVITIAKKTFPISNHVLSLEKQNLRVSYGIF